MWRSTYTIPFWLTIGFVCAIVWPPGALIALAGLVYVVSGWLGAQRASAPDTDTDTEDHS